MRLAKPRRNFGCEINITPLIDIVFLLIIFSMVVSQFAKLQAEGLKLPEAHEGQRPAAPSDGRVVINVLTDGRIKVAGKAQSMASLGALLSAEAARRGAARVSAVVRADRRTPWAWVSQVLELCAARRIDRVKVAVVAPGDEAS